MPRRLWIFGDSFTALARNSPSNVYQRSLTQRLSRHTNEPIELRVMGLPGSAQDWALTQFMRNVDQMTPDDWIVFVATAPSRYWYFYDKPSLSNWNILDFDEVCSKEQAKAVELYIKHIQRLDLDVLQCASRLGLLAYEIHRRKLKPALVVPVVEMLAENCDEFPDLIWSSGDLSKVQFDEYAEPVEAYRRNKEGIPGYFKGVDCRFNHLTLSNHEILSAKMFDSLINGSILDLTSGFHKHTVSEDWYEDQDFIDNELNADLVSHFHTMNDKIKNYVPWKVRSGIAKIVE